LLALQKLGVPFKVHTRLQINLVMGETKFNHEIKKFNHLTLPFMWAEVAIEELTPWLDFLLKMLFNVLPIVQKTIVYLLFLAAVSCLATTILIYLIYKLSAEQPSIPKRSIKYSAVFPYIKREIQRFEDKEREALQKETV